MCVCVCKCARIAQACATVFYIITLSLVMIYCYTAIHLFPSKPMSLSAPPPLPATLNASILPVSPMPYTSIFTLHFNLVSILPLVSVYTPGFFSQLSKHSFPISAPTNCTVRLTPVFNFCHFPANQCSLRFLFLLSAFNSCCIRQLPTPTAPLYWFERIR